MAVLHECADLDLAVDSRPVWSQGTETHHESRLGLCARHGIWMRRPSSGGRPCPGRRERGLPGTALRCSIPRNSGASQESLSTGTADFSCAAPNRLSYFPAQNPILGGNRFGVDSEWPGEDTERRGRMGKDQGGDRSRRRMTLRKREEGRGQGKGRPGINLILAPRGGYRCG